MLVQCAIIFICLLLGEGIAAATGLRIPGSIIGMVLLTALLEARIVRPHQVEGVCNFLLANMGFFFIPAGVGLMLYLDLIASQWVAIVVASAVSTIIVMLVTGFIHQYLRRHARRR
jgi:holin-like protein